MHVPKAAGTTISHALYGRSLGHLKAADIRFFAPLTFSRLYKFGLVRNPWDRAVSAYHFVCQGGTETAGVYRREQYQIPEFRSFEVFVREWLVGRSLRKLDPVFQPQRDYLYGANDVLLADFVGKVEQFDDAMERVFERLGRRIPIRSLNRSVREADFRSYYPNNALIQAVGDAYADDIRLFNYDF